MNKKKYESPVMTEILVELEQGFLKGSIVDNNGKGTEVKANQQDYVEFDGSDSGNITWE